MLSTQGPFDNSGQLALQQSRPCRHENLLAQKTKKYEHAREWEHICEIQASNLQGQPDPTIASPRSPLGVKSTRPCGAALRLQMCSCPCIVQCKLASWFKNLRFLLGSGHPLAGVPGAAGEPRRANLARRVDLARRVSVPRRVNVARTVNLARRVNLTRRVSLTDHSDFMD